VRSSRRRWEHVVKPWTRDEDGSRHFVIWADLLLSEGYAVNDVTGRLFTDLTKRHEIIGWEFSSGPVPGTELEIELVGEAEDTAVRRSLLWLGTPHPGSRALSYSTTTHWIHPHIPDPALSKLGRVSRPLVEVSIDRPVGYGRAAHERA
jgi:hypothetical protein